MTVSQIKSLESVVEKDGVAIKDVFDDARLKKNLAAVCKALCKVGVDQVTFRFVGKTIEGRLAMAVYIAHGDDFKPHLENLKVSGLEPTEAGDCDGAQKTVRKDLKSAAVYLMADFLSLHLEEKCKKFDQWGGLVRIDVNHRKMNVHNTFQIIESDKMEISLAGCRRRKESLN